MKNIFTFEIESLEENSTFELNHQSKEYIRWVQKALNKILGLSLVEDGIMGPKTKEAICNFQKIAGLVVDGIVGPLTEQALIAHGAPPPPKKVVIKTFLKDSFVLQSAPLTPVPLLSINSNWPSIRQAMASTYNRLGGLMSAIAKQCSIPVQVVLAVWYIESGKRGFSEDGRAIIRFENHLFYKVWGTQNQALYNRYFKHGGHNGEPGKPWENHKVREREKEEFKSFHGNQNLEYQVLMLAAKLAGEDPALRSISIGGPQILILNHALIGYKTPKEMYYAFQCGERSHVFGFFDFCLNAQAPTKGDLLNYLKNFQWQNFAKYYNGPGQAETYGGRLQNAYKHAVELPI